jgi:tRNA(Ile)-lysidine synthase
VMRLNRGAGARGLAGMRPVAQLPAPGSKVRLVRPLLGWRRSELEQLCRSARLEPVQDPSNADERFERVNVRRAIAGADWIDPEGIARSADHLARADDALEWATDREWQSQVSAGEQSIAYRPSGPTEIRRRIVARCIQQLASEGRGDLLRGRELDQLVGVLTDGGKATLRGVLCSGGEQWDFAPAPERRQTA